MLGSMRRCRGIQFQFTRCGLSSLVFESNGAPLSVLKFQPSVGVGNLGPGDVKVSMKSLPVLVEDILAIQGVSFARSKPGIAGSTGYGTVSAVGAQISNIAPADSVFVSSIGCWSQDVIISASNVVKTPKLTSSQVSSIPAAVSALGILRKFDAIKSGDIIVQLNGDSDVGKAISQIGKEKGYKVINATVESLSDTAAFKKANGDIKYGVTGTSGKPSQGLMKVLSDQGIVVAYNSSSFIAQDFGAIDVPIRAFIFSGVSLQGFDLSSFATSSPAHFQSAVTEAVAMIQSKKLSLPSKVFPIAEFAKAVATVEKSAGVAALEL